MTSLIPFVAFAAIAGALLYHALHADRKRRAAAVALAGQRGFQIQVEDKAPPPLGFDLFRLGTRRTVSYHIWPPGSQDSAFQYRYTTGSGKNRQIHRRSAVLVQVPFTAPHLKIGPEGFWSSIGKMVGVRDVEVESPQFNERYRVACDDERFAITLLDPSMIAWMLSPHSGGGTVTFEFGGSWMLCWGDDVPFEQLFGYLEWAQHVRGVLPAVLTSLYPAT